MIANGIELYTVIVRLHGKRADLLAEVTVSTMQHFKGRLKTITLDNGRTFSAYETIAEALGAQIDFAHPHALWECGINKTPMG